MGETHPRFFLRLDISETNNGDTMQSNVVAFDGLDDAILGTCSRGHDAEVVAYDFNKVVELFSEMGWTIDEVDTWIHEMTESIPEEYFPIFVYLDDSVKTDIQVGRGGVH